MDWWEFTFVYTAVLVTVCCFSEETLLGGVDVIPGTHHKFSDNGCPPDTIFCMDSMKCVNLDGTCIEPPECEAWQVLQESHLGVYMCVNIEDTCWPDSEEACDVNGVLMCVPRGKCPSLRVTLTVSADFHQMIGNDYDQAEMMFMAQIATATGLGLHQLLDFKIMEDPTSLTFRVPLSASSYSQLSALENTQFLYDKSNNQLYIDWSTSWMDEENPFEEHTKEPKYCKPGQIYCFQEGRCVNMDGTCPAGLSCDQYQMLCNVDGGLTCVPAGSCTYVQAGLYLEHADYHGVLGNAYEHMTEFENHVKELLTYNIPGSAPDDFYDFTFEPGSIYIRFSANPKLYESFQSLITSLSQFMTDLNDQQLKINYHKSYAEIVKGYDVVCKDGTCTTCPDDQMYDEKTASCIISHDNNLPDYNAMGYGERNCKLGQIFCIEAMRCVNIDGTCAEEPTCDSYQVLCKTERGLECVDHGQCNYTEVWLYFGSADFTAVIGPEFENMKAFLQHIKENIMDTITGSLESDFWNLQAKPGSIYTGFSTNPMFYKRFMELQQLDVQFVKEFSGHPLHINWDKSFVHQVSHYGYNTECRDGECISCPGDAMVDWDAKACVIYDNNHGDGEKDGHHSDDVKDGHTCDYNEIFCFETMSCVTTDGHCPHPDCGSSQKVCSIDGDLVCMPSCQYAKFAISMDGNFFEIVGSSYERYNIVRDSLTKQLAEQLTISSNEFIETYIWNGSLNFGGKTAHEFLAKLQKLVDDKSLRFQLNEKPMTINYDKTFVYEETEYGDDYYHDNGEDKDPDSCPECKVDGMTCGMNEIFCFETMSCVNTDGHCPHPDCGNSQKVCYVDGDFVCTPSCLYAKFAISMEGNFFEIVGNSYERYNIVRDSLTKQLAEQLMISPNDFIETYLWNGSLNFGGKTAHEFLATLQKLVDDKSLSFQLNEKPMTINYVKTFVYEDTEYGDDYYHDNGGDKDPDSCPKCMDDGMACGMGEIFCIESGGCVKMDGSCIDKPNECPYDDEILCPDGVGGYECRPRDECGTDMNDVISVRCNMTLDADFELFVSPDNGNVVRGAVSGMMENVAGVSQDNIEDMLLLPGSIRVHLTLVGQPEKLKIALYSIMSYVKINGTLDIGGKLVKISSFVHEDIYDNGSGDDKNDGDNSMIECPRPLIYCFQTRQCVNEDGTCDEETETCAIQGEIPCDDGFGGTTCKPYEQCKNMSTSLTLQVSLKLQGNFVEVVGDKKEMAIQDLQKELPIKLGTSTKLVVRDVLSGSIVILMDVHVSSTEEFDDFIARLKMFVDKPGSIYLIGHLLHAESYEILSGNDNTGGEFPDDYDDHAVTCSGGMIFCIETGACVYPDGKCDGDNQCENPEEMPCDDGLGGFTCQPVGSCKTINATKVTLTLDGNYNEIIGENKKMAMQDLQTYLSAKLNIKPDQLIVHDILSGSIIVLFDIKASVEEVKAIRALLQSLVDNKEQLILLTKSLTVISFTISGDHQTDGVDNENGGYPGKDNDGNEKSMTCPSGQLFCFESKTCIDENGNCVIESKPSLCSGEDQVFCPGKNLCVPKSSDLTTCMPKTNECNDTHARCYNLGVSESAQCVPKQTCQIKQFCPMPAPDTVSTCQVTCNPMEDKANTNGQICCPNACGGESAGVYMDPLNYYVCPRDENTGICLTQPETQCDPGMIFCTAMDMCVKEDYDLATCEPEVVECDENQSYCLDAQGYGTCVPADTCTIRSIKIKMATDADFSTMIAQEQKVLDELIPQLKQLLNVDDSVLQNTELFQGSLGILVTLIITDPKEAESLLSQLEAMVQQSKVSFMILGTKYLVKPDSFKVAVDLVIFEDTDCLKTDSCLECADGEAPCLNLDESKSVKCVPNYLCRMESACPVLDKDSTSICQSECDPKQDKKNADGKLCCPSSCGGQISGLYVEPVTRYVCPVDDVTGVCLTDADIKCETGKEWCSVTFTCETKDYCDEQALQHNVDDITKSELFILRVPFTANGQKFVTVFEPQDTTTTFQENVDKFSILMKEQLLNILKIADKDVTVDAVVVYPETKDTRTFSVYAEIRCKILSASDIKEKVTALLSSNTVEYSLEAGKHPSVTAVLGTQGNQIFVIPTPMVAGTDTVFELFSVVSPTSFTTSSVKATLDCSETEGVNVLAGTSVSASNSVSSEQEFAIHHKLTDIQLVKCQVVTSQLKTLPDGVGVYIGFIAVPKDVGKLGAISNIDVTVDNVELEEDSDCTGLPDNLFSIEHEGDVLFELLSNFPAKMTGNNEVWKGQVLDGLQGLFLRYILTRDNVLKNFRVSVSIAADTTGSRPAKLLYRGEPVRATDVTNLLSASDNLQYLFVCVRADYNGIFTIDITEVVAGEQVRQVKVPVKVNGKNDAPKLTRTTEIPAGFAYPMVPKAGESSETPVFTVQKLVETFAVDQDGDALGMGLIGVMTTEIDGKWEWSMNGGETWETLAAMDKLPDTEEVTSEVKLLGPSDFIRFTVGESHKSVTWLLDQAPTIIALAWDGFQSDVSVKTDTVTLTICNTFETGMLKYCYAGPDSTFSKEIFEFSLPRIGCDGEPDSGKEMKQCGCADDRSCLDCNNVINGDAKVDACGVCGGTNTEVNCDVDECKQVRTSYCEMQETFIDSMSDMCKEGEILNKEHIDTCGVCIKEGTTIETDQCGVPCGDNDCLDCAGQKGLYEMNICHECKLISELKDNCGSDKITIGNIQPASSIPLSVMNVTVNVSGLTTKIKPEISECHLEAKEGNIEAPVVLMTTYLENNPTVVLTIQAKSSIGHFGISCTIDGQVASTKDNDQYLWLYNQPTLSSVEPSRILISEISDLTITGSGFIDTGLVICARPCLSDETCVYKYAEGTRVSDTTVICPAKRLITRKRGQTYTIYIVLQKLQTVDIESILTSSGVQFTVVLPPPRAISAVLDRNGCSKLIVRFSSKVIGTSGDSCADYFTSPTLDDAEDKCILPKGGKRMFIEFKTTVEAGTELTFKPDVISSAADHNSDDQNVEKLTGSITVENDGEEEEGKPVVMIDPRTPNVVGCSPVTVSLIIKNRGCWDIKVNWIVSADSVGAEHITSLQEKTGTSTSFTITGSDLQDGITYNITVKWTAGKHNGEDWRTIMKDSASNAAVHISGIGEDAIDVNDAVVVKAMLSLCKDDMSIPTITWSLMPNDYTLQPYFKALIPKGELQPRTQYNLTCQVKTGDNSEVTGFVLFKTKPRPIQPLIESNTDRPMYEDDVTLTCSDQLDPAANKEDFMVTWVCYDNVISGNEDEDDFKPCFEYSAEVNNYIPVERSDLSITLGNVDRMKPRNGQNLVQKWTCELRRKSVLDLVYSTSIKLKFTSEQIVLEAPEIKSKTPEMIYLAEGESFIVKIRASIRKATGCRWWTNDMEVALEGTEDIPLDVTKYRTNGYLERTDLKYSETTYEMCYIKLNLRDAGLIPAHFYVLKLYAYNKGSRFIVPNSREFKVMVVPHPKPGIIQIGAEESPVIALTTSIKITLGGWHDQQFDADLRCNFYYTNLDSIESSRTRINTVPVSMDVQGEKTTLPEGRNKIEVECCNFFKKCAWMEADDVITAEPVDQTGVLTVIEQTLPQLLSLDTENALSFVAELKRTMEKKVVDEVKKEQAAKDLKQAMKKAIKRALEIASDIKNKLSVIEQTTDAVETPEELDEEVKEDLKKNVEEILDEAVGNDNSRRKRRSTTESSKPTGLTAEEASIALKGLDTVTSEDTMDKEDAKFFKKVVDEVMVAMCINFTGSEPWLAPADLSYVRLHKTNLTGYAALQSDVSCDTCPEVDYPAKVKYGSYLESYFEGSWNCTFYDPCIDVCVATAQINIDYVTLTAEQEVVAPTRKSDIIILRMISPENYAVTDMSDLPTPIEATLTINGTLDMDKYDYKCLMWVSEDWSDQQCNISTPIAVPSTSQYTAVCKCNALGIISIFQELKQEEIVTTTTNSPSTTTTTTKVTTAAPPSKDLEEDTKFAKVEFSFVDDYDTSVGGSVTDFNEKIKNDIAIGTGISKNSIKNLKSEKGSIIITFELHEADSGFTLGQLVYKVESAITTGTITFTSPGGGSLSIIANSFKYEEIQDDDKDDGDDESGSNKLLIIIGAALGGLVIVCVTVIVVLLILKSKKQRTHPSANATDGPNPRYATPPPAYAISQPPPPFLYDEPPQVNKWVEDELKKAPEDKQRPPSSRSDGSGTSYEQKLLKKGSKAGPTPVGE